jgi:hypothetical protein
MSEKRTPAEIWKELEKQAREDEARDDAEIAEIAAMSPAELDAELAAGGFDPEEVKAEALELRRELERRVVARRAGELEAEARVRSMRPAARRRPVAFWLAAAATGAIATGGLVYALTRAPAPEPPPPAPPAPSSAPRPEPAPPEPPLVAAQRLRRHARDVCAAGFWETCEADLADAKRLDPAGDAEPEVQRLWMMAHDRKK